MLGKQGGKHYSESEEVRTCPFEDKFTIRVRYID